MKKSQLKQLIRECIQEVLDEGLMSRLGGLGLAGALTLSPAAFGGSKELPRKPAVTQTRGIKNNNPGNIEVDKDVKWNGEIGADGRFVKFSSPEYGIRALAITMRTYATKHKLDTIEGIVSRWAPPFENDTNGYIQFVSQKMGKKPNEKINISNKQELKKLVSAIIERENSSVPYDDATLTRGIGMI